MKRLFVLIATFLIYECSCAANVDTAMIYSKAMGTSMKCVVIIPATKKIDERFPTVYLLHGYGGDFSNWIKKVPELKEYADAYKIIIVCPEGRTNSWYFDSPVDTTVKFETYIGKEVPDYIDKTYPTIKDRRSRAITGLSMGGYGALLIGLRNSNYFGAAGSMSGVVDLTVIRNKYELMKRLGDTITHAHNWTTYSVMNAIENYSNNIAKVNTPLSIIFDCGIEDVFYADNKRLHEKMVRLKIPHDFIARTGTHSWNYWANAIRYQLLYFKDYFKRDKK